MNLRRAASYIYARQEQLQLLRASMVQFEGTARVPLDPPGTV
jgi:hypothetical protein